MTKSAPKISISIPPISRYPSRREWEAACWRELLASPRSVALLATAKECHSLVMRAAVISRISDGKRPREISKELQISRQTIMAVRKALQECAYRSYRERGKTERKRGMYGSRRYPTERRAGRRSIRTKYGMVYLP
ncbi:hypothetical protein COU12_02580 [Candidatus Jorgensenbacteria bacterium CG10_big_fil_rev_8_21_14_0_10_54_38]|uniref:Uncharacterized protein n=2 Tax=Candidatus Joergenseniibacteriota TaxID=1752739 RepID=A0A2M6WFL1_9BACT|nr:MAG: hypothetical protein COX26_00295 [Candidatus Jorgensenbacteria bacterium CG23_combo_of_CG06-09_8_20_14_all_54_14]PIT91556.1 MAG: hypothetical protein COU12_02580 [Candidatus Jorgensenbacteria bacterium CG10_big_fil_rev_8_21_14_0_10_54_38]